MKSSLLCAVVISPRVRDWSLLCPQRSAETCEKRSASGRDLRVGVEQAGAGVEAWLESCMVNTSLNPPLSLLGLQPHSEACGAQGDNSGTLPKKVPEKDQVNMVAVSSCNHFWNPVPVWATPCPGLVSVGYILGPVCCAIYFLKCQVFMQETTGFCVSRSSP